MTGDDYVRSLPRKRLRSAAPDRISALLMRAYALSAREQQVARLVLRGTAAEEIARTLSISRHTAKDHLKAIFTKVGAHSARQAAAELTGRTAN